MLVDISSLAGNHEGLITRQLMVKILSLLFGEMNFFVTLHFDHEKGSPSLSGIIISEKLLPLTMGKQTSFKDGFLFLVPFFPSQQSLGTSAGAVS